jgi:hypothetical protein
MILPDTVSKNGRTARITKLPPVTYYGPWWYSIVLYEAGRPVRGSKVYAATQLAAFEAARIMVGA